jgi:hypothetical protein
MFSRPGGVFLNRPSKRAAQNPTYRVTRNKRADTKFPVLDVWQTVRPGQPYTRPIPRSRPAATPQTKPRCRPAHCRDRIIVPLRSDRMKNIRRIRPCNEFKPVQYDSTVEVIQTTGLAIVQQPGRVRCETPSLADHSQITPSGSQNKRKMKPRQVRNSTNLCRKRDFFVQRISCCALKRRTVYPSVQLESAGVKIGKISRATD